MNDRIYFPLLLLCGIIILGITATIWNGCQRLDNLNRSVLPVPAPVTESHPTVILGEGSVQLTLKIYVADKAFRDIAHEAVVELDPPEGDE